MSDDATVTQQAEQIVQALDAYLSTLPWPAPTVERWNQPAIDPKAARAHLVQAIALALHGREPRMSDWQRLML